jgi:hypothetical protein
MLSMEDEVAQAIALQIDSSLPGRPKRRSPEPAAYLPYLEGRYYWNKRTRYISGSATKRRHWRHWSGRMRSTTGR